MINANLKEFSSINIGSLSKLMRSEHKVFCHQTLRRLSTICLRQLRGPDPLQISHHLPNLSNLCALDGLKALIIWNDVAIGFHLREYIPRLLGREISRLASPNTSRRK